MDKLKAHPDDVLNALLCDLLADQVRRTLELGFTVEQVQEAVSRGLDHGLYEFGAANKHQ
jgi:hypothetical protein